MEEIRILETDNHEIMAEKIYQSFIVGQSCSIKGFVLDFDKTEQSERGRMVWERVLELDRFDNFEPHVAGKMRRKRVVLNNSNGAGVAHKIFRFKREFRRETIVWSIWRVQ